MGDDVLRFSYEKSNAGLEVCTGAVENHFLMIKLFRSQYRADRLEKTNETLRQNLLLTSEEFQIEIRKWKELSKEQKEFEKERLSVDELTQRLIKERNEITKELARVKEETERNRAHKTGMSEAPLEVTEQRHLPSCIPVPVVPARKRKTTKGRTVNEPDIEEINPVSTAKRMKRSRAGFSRPKVKSLRAKTTVNDAEMTRIGKNFRNPKGSLSVSQEIEQRDDVKVDVLEETLDVVKESKHGKLMEENRKLRGQITRKQLKDHVQLGNHGHTFPGDRLLSSPEYLMRCSLPDDQKNDEKMKEGGKLLSNLDSSQISCGGTPPIKQKQKKQTKRLVGIQPKRARNRVPKIKELHKVTELQTVMLSKVKDDPLLQDRDDHLDTAMDTGMSERHKHPSAKGDAPCTTPTGMHVEDHVDVDAAGSVGNKKLATKQNKRRKVAYQKKASSEQLVKDDGKDSERVQSSQKEPQFADVQPVSQSHENSLTHDREKEPKIKKQRVAKPHAATVVTETNVVVANDADDAILDAALQPSKQKVSRGMTKPRKAATGQRKQVNKLPVKDKINVRISQSTQSSQECTVPQDAHICDNHASKGVDNSCETRRTVQTRGKHTVTPAQATTATAKETSLIVKDADALQPTLEAGVMGQHTVLSQPLQTQHTEIAPSSSHADSHSLTVITTESAKEEAVPKKRSQSRKTKADESMPLEQGRKKVARRKKNAKQSQSLQTGEECSVEQSVANRSTRSKSKDSVTSTDVINDSKSETGSSTVKRPTAQKESNTNSCSKLVTQSHSSDNQTQVTTPKGHSPRSSKSSGKRKLFSKQKQQSTHLNFDASASTAYSNRTRVSTGKSLMKSGLFGNPILSQFMRNFQPPPLRKRVEQKT